MSVRLESPYHCYVVVLPSLALLLTFVYLPVFWALASSLYEFEIGTTAHFVGLANYHEYLTTDPTTFPSLANMLALTLIAVCMRLSFPLIVARLIYALPHERWRYFYRIIFLIPIVVPSVAVQLIWLGMVYSDFGMVNELLTRLNLESWTRGWLSNPDTALAAVALVGFPFVGGFEVLVYYAGFAAIPESVNEATAIDGCTGVQKFFRVDIPMVLSQLKLILILTLIGGIQGFENLFVLTRGGPGFETTVPGLWMYFNAFSFQRMGYACAIGVLLFLIIFSLTLLNMKYFKSSEELQGVQ